MGFWHLRTTNMLTPLTSRTLRYADTCEVSVPVTHRLLALLCAAVCARVTHQASHVFAPAVHRGLGAGHTLLPLTYLCQGHTCAYIVLRAVLPSSIDAKTSVAMVSQSGTGAKIASTFLRELSNYSTVPALYFCRLCQLQSVFSPSFSSIFPFPFNFRP